MNHQDLLDRIRRERERELENQRSRRFLPTQQFAELVREADAAYGEDSDEPRCKSTLRG